jgi:MarR family transcriptional regulator, transcriptional regulator for hemolysin
MPAEDRAEPSLGYLLADVVRLMRRDFHNRASGLGLTPALTRLLFYVHKQPGRRQSELAQLLDVTPVTLCRMVDRLVARGYARRAPDPRDRRAVRVFEAPRAKPLLVRMTRIASLTNSRAQRGFAHRERTELQRLLAALRRNLDGGR